MKIFFIENENPARDSSGGIMSYLVNLSKYLIKEKIETILIGNGNYSEAPSNRLFSKFISVSKNEDISNYRYLFNLCKKNVQSVFEKNAIIHIQRPDMVIPLILKSVVQKNVIICSLHGAHDIGVYDKKGLLQGVIYFLLQFIAFVFVDLLIAVDEGTKQHYIKKFSWLEKKIKVIPIAVDTEKFFIMNKKELREKFNFKVDDKILIFVGRLEKEKNISFIIDSFEKTKVKEPKAKLLLVGNGRDIDDLKEYVINKKIEDVIFWGEVSNSEIPELLNCADVFVFASLYEGSPTVIKEALSCNLPVVSVDVGDVKSVIENVDGCFIADKNINDFSSKLAKALNYSQPFEGRKRAMDFNSESVGQMTLNMYKELIGNSK